MNYFISTNSSFIRLTLEGKPNERQLLEAIIKANDALINASLTIVMIDSLGLTTPINLSTKYSVISQLGKYNISRKTTVVAVSNASKAETVIVENVAYNRGWKIKYFKNIDAAKTWIEDYNSINENTKSVI
ncbi:hypothetical protein [Flammeovirga kamogawensis]|uniref:STAS/SEC14 domain-containing protein n=1 Tax=Flammeovirga kamogawensis TaxID=373891 RepID=A0ABX8H1E1_9BACT|nr:hypothetical protein [Flammeovirga kamogawensis]MBB6463792.1 hypothetical protein [Flammeovirga kamogawensis]QWG09700.1 hypothetical protein KM029_24175 [Flammeovirga kamogawensis]TRX65211.1 hypothetical protein EO216_22065 [Flammeovirga kamogawensis]